jgi:hypothetical protein
MPVQRRIADPRLRSLLVHFSCVHRSLPRIAGPGTLPPWLLAASLYLLALSALMDAPILPAQFGSGTDCRYRRC